MVATIQSEVRRKMPAYFHFKPRPDQPERYDEQTAFYESKTDGVSWLLGGNGAGTTTTLLAKVARFVYETPPPRVDTPFWVIAKSYDQVTKTCWKEKLYGQGHILDRDIDWERVSWYKSKERLPFAVPLRPHANGNNWMLEFKSYEQGAGQMMAQAIGGFAFVEQFPWGVFEEVLRGCREYNFPGSKLCEYTPVDPDMSLDIEEMIENGPDPGPDLRQPHTRYLPANWKIYHANTMCAMEAGHVDAEWFKEFFGMIPTDMLETRMKGLFASYEGVIYKDFNPATHCMGDEIWPQINGVQHFRGIDWGAGPENDFVCLWGARNSLGQWFIYDEYCSHEPITALDHLKEVQERWQWPKHDKNFGITFADPSSAGNIRIANRLSQFMPGVPNLSMGMGNNSVLEGIEHIQYLLKPTALVFNPETREFDKRPKLFIHRQNCPELVKQMRTYRWIRGSDPNVKLARNPKNPKREPLKFRDHACLIFDTNVVTIDGIKPITEVKAGDMVACRDGFTKVLVGFTVTRQNCPVYKVETESGQCVTTTEDHRLWMASEGQWRTTKEISENLRQNQSSEESGTECATNPSLFVATHTLDTLIADTNQQDTSAEPLQRSRVSEESCCTELCTNCSEDQYHPDDNGTYTTRMKTSETADLKTCNCSETGNISSCMRNSQTAPHTTTGANKTLNESKRLRQEQATLTTKGTTNTQQNSNAVCAERRSCRSTSDSMNDVTAVTNAAMSQRKLVVHVSSAEVSSEDTKEQSVAADRVLQVTEAGTQDVCCLATEAGEFVVEGGFVVKNCDALRYMVFTADNRANLTIESARTRLQTEQVQEQFQQRSGGWRGVTGQHKANRS